MTHQMSLLGGGGQGQARVQYNEVQWVIVTWESPYLHRHTHTHTCENITFPQLRWRAVTTCLIQQISQSLNGKLLWYALTLGLYLIYGHESLIFRSWLGRASWMRALYIIGVCRIRFGITSNDRSFDCSVIYTDTIHKVILFIDSTKIIL